MSTTEPVADPTTDYDIFAPEFVADPYPVYEAIRSRCPVAHTERHQGSWMPTTYEALHDIAHDVDTFSSSDILVFPRPVLPEGFPYADVGRTADLLGSAGAPVGPQARAAVLLPGGRAPVRGGHPRAVPPAHRRLHRTRSRRRGRRLRPADPRAGDRRDARCRRVPVRRVRRMGASDPRAGTPRAHEAHRGPHGPARLLRGAGRRPTRPPPRGRPHHAARRGRGRRRTRARRPHPRHLQPDARRGHRHDVVGHRLIAVAPRPAPRAPRSAPRRPGPLAQRHRGAAARLLAGHDGPHRRGGHRVRRVPDARGRPRADAVPGREPRPSGVRRPGRGAPRSRGKPSPGVRLGDPPLCGVEPGPPRAPRVAAGVPRAHPRVRAGGFDRRDVGGRSGARTPPLRGALRRAVS